MGELVVGDRSVAEGLPAQKWCLAERFQRADHSGPVVRNGDPGTFPKDSENLAKHHSFVCRFRDHSWRREPSRSRDQGINYELRSQYPRADQSL